MHTAYLNLTMRELRDQQVRFAPREKKVEQVNRAEKLLVEIDPAKTYSYEYLCFRITNFRPEAAQNATMSGEEARHDLRLFVEDVSDAADIRAEEVGEPVHTVEDLSKLFNVSSKTIARWRDRGLVSRRFLFGGRKRVGFLHSSVQHFVSRNEECVKRGERFSQLSEDEKREIIERARRLTHAGGCPTDIIRRVARHMNRSVETIRYTLRKFDQDHPQLAVFPQRSGPLTDQEKEDLYHQYRRGVGVDELADRFGRTRPSVYRLINEMRARRIMSLPLDFIPNPEFDRSQAANVILVPMPAGDPSAKRSRVPSGLPPYLASLYEVPLLTKDQEQHLFRKFNFLKHQAARLRDSLDLARPRGSVMDRIEELYEQAVAIKNQIVQANLRLVVSIAKRHVNAPEDFFELVSDGNMSLIRAVEKFDYARGNKFSTYATWAIMKNYARTIPDEFKHRDRYRTSLDEMFVAAEDTRSDVFGQESAQRLREEQVERILSRLDERERKIIVRRFGLNRGDEPLTLKEVGLELGVTKERVRQIEARVLSKLREAAEAERIEIPD